MNVFIALKGTYFLFLSLFTWLPVAQSVESPLRGTGGHGFDPGPLLAALRLALKSLDWSTQCQDNVTGCGVKCLGHDTSVRQHYKSEH